MLRYGAEALLHYMFLITVNIGGLKFIGQVGEALGNSCKAKDEYTSFMSTIQSTQYILHWIQRLQLKDISQESIQEYKKIALNIQEAVDSFKQKLMEKFGDSLAADSNSVQFTKKLKIALSKMGWTYIKSLVEEFQSSMTFQITILNTLNSHMTMYVGISYMCLIIISFEGVLNVFVSQGNARESELPSPQRSAGPRCLAVRWVCFTNILSRLAVKV